MKILLTSLFMLTFFIRLSPQSGPREKGLNSITENAVKAQLEFLSSDYMEGRETGTKGNLLAAEYIASMFKVYGIQPGGNTEKEEMTMRDYIRRKQPKEYKTFFSTFPLIEFETGERQELSISDEKTKNILTYNTDYRVYPPSYGVELKAPVVFVGYGIKDETKEYNDFSDVNITGKFILRLDGFPGHKDTSSEAYKKFKSLRPWQLRREKNKAAEELGAAGIIEIKKAEDLTDWSVSEPFRINTHYYEGDKELPRSSARMQLAGDTLETEPILLSITLRAANEILRGSGLNFTEFEESAARTLKPASKLIKGKTVTLISTVKSKIITARNVLGIIPGESLNEVVVVGAHFDHTGMRQGYIWNGSDDNASGTVAVMCLARAFAESGIKPKKTIVFAAWTGEEKGLLGSEYFVSQVNKQGMDVLLNLNYDMISRNSDTDSAGVECSMVYTKAYPELEKITVKNNEEQKFGLKIEFEPSEKPSGGSDHAPFADKNIPVMYFMAGFHEDYHQPGDTADKADIQKMTKIIKLGFLNLWDIINGDKDYLSSK